MVRETSYENRPTSPTSSTFSHSLHEELPAVVDLPIHERFNLTSRILEIQVEGMLFRVHRDVLYPQSSVIRELVNNSPCDDMGCSHLRFDDPEFKRVDVERLLDLVYPQDWTKHSASTADEWISILRLASLWKFETVRTLAISQLIPLASDLDKIIVGRRWDVPSWLVPAYTAVCMRGSSLSIEEALRLGIHEAVRIAHVQLAYAKATRVGAVAKPAASSSPMFGMSVSAGTSSFVVQLALSTHDVEQLVERTFLVGSYTPIKKGEAALEERGKARAANGDGFSPQTVFPLSAKVGDTVMSPVLPWEVEKPLLFPEPAPEPALPADPIPVEDADDKTDEPAPPAEDVEEEYIPRSRTKLGKRTKIDRRR